MLGLLLLQKRKLGPFTVAETVFPLDRIDQALPVTRGQSVAAVCGSFDQVLSLSKQGPRRVVAYAADARQAALADLKWNAFRRLEREETLAFLGYREVPAAKRRALLERLEPGLQRETRTLLARRPEVVDQGPLEFGLFRQWVGLLAEQLQTHLSDAETLDKLLGRTPGTRSDRTQLFRARVRGSRLVRFAVEPLLRVFPGLVDKHFFVQQRALDPSAVRQLTRDAFDLLERLVGSGLVKNPALQRHLGGPMPRHLEECLYSDEAYEQVRRHAGRIEIVNLDAVSGLRRETGESFDHFFLGNLADFLAPEWCGWLHKELQRCARPGARLLSYSLLTSDRFQRARSPRLQLEDRLSLSLSSQEPTGLFPVVSAYEVAGGKTRVQVRPTA